MAGFVALCGCGEVSLGGPADDAGDTSATQGEDATGDATLSGSASSANDSADQSGGQDEESSGAPVGSSSGPGGTDGPSGTTDTAGSEETGTPAVGAMVLFVNFQGVTLTEGVDDARIDQTSITELAQPLMPFTGDAEAIMTELAADWAPFDVTVTDTRPANGDYTMAVVTPTNPFGFSVGIAALDCDNSNPNGVVAIFAAADSGYTPAFIAAAITRETGYALGLERVTGDADYMSAFPNEDPQFVDECLPHAMAAVCVGQHAVHCPGGGQNSFAEITAFAQ